jgi:selenocysteine lyase/cysteine desulfurase
VSEPRLDRRQLLVRGGLLAGATSLAGAGGYAAARQVAGGRDGGETAVAVGEDSEFLLDSSYANLTTFLLASHPRAVREAIERHRRALDENAALYLREAEPAFENEARAAAGAYLMAPPDEVALTDSTTMGLGLVYGALRLETGDEVVTSEHDFYATHEALRLRVERDGIAVRRVRLYDDPAAASADGIVSAIANALSPRTRAVAVTWVHSSSGVKLPLRELADVIADANPGRAKADRVLLCVDGVHGFGIEDASPPELGADIFVSGCHKWLFGPRGTGIVWARREAWARLAPIIPSFDGRAYIAWLEGREPSDTPPGALMTPGGFHSFEHRWALTEAFAFHAERGRTETAEHTHRLAAQLKDGLAGVPGVTVVTPADPALSSGLVCADVAGVPPPELVDRLREEHRVIASVTPYATAYLRFGPSIANTETDVDRAVVAVAALA